jgi:hypothetical protein
MPPDAQNTILVLLLLSLRLDIPAFDFERTVSVREDIGKTDGVFLDKLVVGRLGKEGSQGVLVPLERLHEFPHGEMRIAIDVPDELRRGDWELRKLSGKRDGVYGGHGVRRRDLA